MKEMDEAEENDIKLEYVKKNQRNISKRWLDNTENEGNRLIILPNLTFAIFHIT